MFIVFFFCCCTRFRAWITIKWAGGVVLSENARLKGVRPVQDVPEEAIQVAPGPSGASRLKSVKLTGWTPNRGPPPRHRGRIDDCVPRRKIASN
ncbi:hypothetical protein TNCT_662391 [Trichonephila clavata]|uniref:Secreted protein n=1 Tax=Trichonephila clavata TaxID=2740835 RepID=A0A8X6FJC0_TRICU|nr:hypothetical protein TNCT_662391 [Trichonephila clavata]